MTLGCGVWSATVLARGGGSVVATDVPATQISVQMRRSETGDATVDVLDRRVCATLGETVRAWSHEVALYRDGSLAWVGPVVGRRISGDRLTWRCRDLSVWLTRRFAREVVATAADAAEVAALVARGALAADPVGLDVEWGAIGVLVSRAYAERDGKPAIEALGEVVDAGAEWAVDRRTLRIGSAVSTADAGEVFGDGWVDEPDVEEDGLTAATRVLIAGPQQRDAAAILGDTTSAAGAAAYGLLEQRFQDDNARDQATAQRLAAVAVARRAEPARLVAGGDLAPTAAVAWSDLRPGCGLWATVRGAGRVHTRLDGVQVRVVGGRETVSVDLEAYDA